MTSSKRKFKLNDEVSARLVQIFQEAMLTGCDGADLLRQVELTEGDVTGMLLLSDEYKSLVKKSHEELLKRAAELETQQKQGAAARTIINFTESE